MTQLQRRALIPLGEGAYTVPEVCRILGPTMTSRKVHYWLDTGLLTEPLSWGERGRPTLLSFHQLLEIRTVQRLRDELQFSLPKVRRAFEWILSELFGTDWRDLRFERHGRDLGARSGDQTMIVPGGQGVLDLTISDLNTEVGETRAAWEQRVFHIPGHPYVVSNPGVLAGAPTVVGTRVETALLASFAVEKEMDDDKLAQVVRLYPRLPPEGVADALRFEGVRIAS